MSLPPLPVQRRIADILSAYDDLIENNNRRIAILEEMAQNLYREWFVHFRFPGHEGVKMVDSPLGPIPEGWEPTTLGDLCDDVRRQVDPQEVDPETPYVGLEHIPRKSVALSQWGYARDVASTKLPFTKGDILFGKIRPYFHKVAVAPVDGICSTDAIVIRPQKPGWAALVLACVSSEEFVAHATQTSQGTKMPRANWNILTAYPIPIPPVELLGRFTGSIDGMMAQVQNLVLRSRILAVSRDLLLPRLVSGELVPTARSRPFSGDWP